MSFIMRRCNVLIITMLQDRQESLMIISCKHDYTEELNLMAVVKHWAQLTEDALSFCAKEQMNYGRKRY